MLQVIGDRDLISAGRRLNGVNMGLDDTDDDDGICEFMINDKSIVKVERGLIDMLVLSWSVPLLEHNN